MMKSEGWETRVFENMGWHYRIVLPIPNSDGGASISPFGDQYFCLISTNHLGAGEQGLYDSKAYNNPNEAFERSLLVFEKLTHFLDQIKKAAYN